MVDSVFITGVSGFIGQALARYFLSRGMTVTGLAHRPTELPGCQVIVGEVVHPSSYASLLSRARIVIHLAAVTLGSQINANPIEAMKVAWRGMANVLDCFRAGDGEHLLFFSSGKVYGIEAKQPVSEEQDLKPTTALGKTKVAAEDLMRYYADYTKRQFTILRVFNAYGPGQRDGFLIPTILSQLSSGIITLGDTKQQRDFIFIDDVVEAVGAALFDNQDSPYVNPNEKVRTINVGSGESHSPSEIVALLNEITGAKVSIHLDKMRMRTNEADEERADVSRLMSLGWRPKVCLKDGLTRTWRSFVDETK